MGLHVASLCAKGRYQSCYSLPLLTCPTHAAAATAARRSVTAGDGAGILCAMPDTFLSACLIEEQGIRLPPLGQYAGEC